MSSIRVEHSAQEVPVPCCIHQEGDLRVKGQIKNKSTKFLSGENNPLFLYFRLDASERAGLYSD